MIENCLSVEQLMEDEGLCIDDTLIALKHTENWFKQTLRAADAMDADPQARLQVLDCLLFVEKQVREAELLKHAHYDLLTNSDVGKSYLAFEIGK